MENSIQTLAPLRTEGTEAPFFIVPSAGGTFFSFFELANRLGDTRPVYSFDLTSVDPDCEEFSSIDKIASKLLDDMQQTHPSGPYNIAGHCWGGLVSHAIAALLAEKGEEVSALILLDAIHPKSTSNNLVTDADDEQSALENIIDQTLENIRIKLNQMPDSLADRLIGVTKGMMLLGRKHSAKQINTPTYLLHTNEVSGSLFLNWSLYCHPSFSQLEVRGGTHTMLESPYVDDLAKSIQEILQ